MNSVDYTILHQLACPCCQGKLELSHDKDRLICQFEKIYFSKVDGVFCLRCSDGLPFDH